MRDEAVPVLRDPCSQDTAVRTLEAALGDATRAAGPLCWPAVMVRDENEQHPMEALARLRDLGIPRLHVPSAFGGDFVDFEHMLAVGRCLSRRDPCVALSFGLGIWSQLAWAIGSDSQRQQVSDWMLEGAPGCLAVSEPAHGADLLAGEVTARPGSGGYVLQGTKWPIGGAGQARHAYVLARTGEDHGPRSLSWFLLDEEALGTASRLPGVKTLGLRGLDLAGLAFHEVPVATNALLGPPGGGLESTLHLFQISRSLVVGMALGATDSALRIASSFAMRRRLYHTPLVSLPLIEDLLIGAYLDLLAAEALARTTVRALHTAPEELSVASAISKVLVPELTGRAMQSCAQVLGARFYLREGFAEGVFQKLFRDHMAVGLFDGSSIVCLQALATQLPLLLGARVRECDTDATRFNLGTALPDFKPPRLELTSRGSDRVLQGLSGLTVPPTLAGARDTIVARRAQLHEEFAAFRARRNPDGARSPQLFHLAHRYAGLHTAAACVQVAARESLEGPPPEWASLAVQRLLNPGIPLREQPSHAHVDAVRQGLFQGVTEARTFSLTPTPLPDSPIVDMHSEE